MDKCEFINDEGKCAKWIRTYDCRPATNDWFTDAVGTIDMSDVCKCTSLWGNTFSEITQEHIESLKNGKVIFIHDGEYGHFIKLKGD